VPRDPAPIDFTITASYLTNSFATIPLENGVPLDYYDAPASNSVFFSFVIPPSNTAVLFELYNATEPVLLRVSRGVLPIFADKTNVFVAPNPSPDGQRIALRSSTFGDITGEWYLQAQVNSTNVANFTVRAVLASDGLLESGQPIVAGIVPSTGGLSITFNTVPGEVYSIRSSPVLTADPTAWVVVTTETAQGDSLLVNLPPPGGGDTSLYYWIVQERQ
jgi:hypothetical protein